MEHNLINIHKFRFKIIYEKCSNLIQSIFISNSSTTGDRRLFFLQVTKRQESFSVIVAAKKLVKPTKSEFSGETMELLIA